MQIACAVIGGTSIGAWGYGRESLSASGVLMCAGWNSALNSTACPVLGHAALIGMSWSDTFLHSWLAQEQLAVDI